MPKGSSAGYLMELQTAGHRHQFPGGNQHELVVAAHAVRLQRQHITETLQECFNDSCLAGVSG